VEAKDVRWLSHDKATTTLRKCLPSIYTSLEREAEERNDARAAGLSVFTQDYRFVLAIHMMCDVLPHLTALSCAMQVMIIILILKIYPVKRQRFQIIFNIA
jgi:hypothetical protein